MAAGESSICADEPAVEARAAPEPGGARGRGGTPGAGERGPARRPAVRRAVERTGALGVPAVWAVRKRKGLPGLADGAGSELGSPVLRDRRKEVGAGVSKHMVIKGENSDTAWYSMLDSEWPAAKAACEAWLRRENFDADGRQLRSLAELRVVPGRR